MRSLVMIKMGLSNLTEGFSSLIDHNLNINLLLHVLKKNYYVLMTHCLIYRKQKFNSFTL